MVKVFCDKCGDPIDYNINGINVDFNSYGVVKFSHSKDKHYELCNVCASKVAEFIKIKVVNNPVNNTVDRNTESEENEN